MKIKTWIKYEESYIPPRCRKPRYTERDEYVDAELCEVKPEDLRLAFEDNSYSGKGKIYFYNGKLWSKVKRGGFICDPGERGISTVLDELKHRNENCSWFFPREWRDGEHPDREKMLLAVKHEMENFILISGEVYEQTNEPRYCINTFGLGGNHGGTGMFVEYHYNSNIRNDNYFSALDSDAAVAYANKVAAGRGDTEDVGKFHKMITVYMPEFVTVKPKEQHGEGDPFLNKIEGTINACGGDSLTAGLLCLSIVANNK